MKKSLLIFLYFMSWWALKGQTSPVIIDPSTSSALPTTIYHCGTGQLNVKVNASASVATSNYTITPITKTPDTFNTPVPFSRNVTDIFSNSISIPFTNGFTFFGKKYTKFAVGTNGRLVFTNDQVGGSDLIDLLHTSAYTDDYLSNISTKLASLDFNKISTTNSNPYNIASIFGGWTYLAQNVTGTLPRPVYYKADASKVIVLFNDVSQQGSSTTKNNVLFYLYPDNTFDIVITRKGLSTIPQAQNAIVGIQNEDATKAQWPLKNDIDYYNNGTWSIDATSPKTYHFEPVTEPLTPVVKWQLDGVDIPGSNDSNPYAFDLSTVTNNSAKLKAVINYVKSNDHSQVVSIETSNEITLKKMPLSLALLLAVNNCNISASLAIDPSSIPSVDYGAFTFQWYIDNTAISGATLPTLTTTTSGSHVYRVVATSKYFPSCSVFADQTVALVSNLPTFTDKANVGLCDTNGATSTSVNLDSAQYFPAGPGKGTLYQVTYLDNNGVQLPSSTIVINNGTTVSGKVKVEPLPLGSCTAVTYNYSITYTSLPQPTTYNLGPFCSGINAYLLSDFETQFAGKGYTFKYKRPIDASFGVLTSVDPTANPDIEVQISAPGVSCTTISNIHFNINPPVTATPATTVLPDICSTQTAGFNLKILDSQINGTPGVIITYSDSFGVIANPSSYIPRDASGNVKTGATTIYAIVTQTTGSLTCQSQQIVATTVNVYQKPTLKITSPIVMAQCAGSTTYNLVIPNANWGTLVDNPSLIDHIEYYAPGSTVPMTAAQAGAYDFSLGANPTMKIVYKNGSCDDTVGFNLIQNPLPAPKSTPIYFCGDTSKTLGQIKSDIIANPQNYIFKYGGTTLADSYVFQTNTDYNLTIEDATTHCPVSYTLHFTQGSGISVLPSYQYPQVCDSDFDGKTQIDLTKVQSTITADPNASFTYYSGGVLISTPTTYMTKGVNDVVDVVVSSSTPGLCPSNTQIIIKVDLPIIPQGVIQNYAYPICYNENFSLNITNDVNDYDSIDWVDSKGTVIATGAQLYIPFNTNIYGNYSVIVKTKGAQCPYIVNFSITDTNQPKIVKVNTNNNQIEVIATGGKTPYTYYYKGVPSGSNIFTNPTEPKYTIQVQGRDGCMGPPVDVYFISVNNVITPNGDGINDYWEVKNLDKMQNVQMVISDRMGTVVFQSNNVNNLRWDGKQNGRSLPTASYWYVIKWQDPATQEVITRTGWILLKNRN